MQKLNRETSSRLFATNQLPRRRRGLALGAVAWLCLAGCGAEFEPAADSSPAGEPVQSVSQSAVTDTAYDFPMRKEDRQPGTFWRPSQDHYDLSLWRFDDLDERWTRSHSRGDTYPADIEEHLAYGEPVYAIEAGVVVTCWRNTPDNPVAGRVRQGRLGCDPGSDGNHCGQAPCTGGSCECTIPLSGNHVRILASDGTTIRYSHFIPGTVPQELCPHDDVLVADADDDSGPDDFHPEQYVDPETAASVEQGQFLGFIGNSGNSCGPHLHLSREFYPRSEDIPIRFNRGEHQPFPGADSDRDPSAWQNLTGQTLDLDPPELVLPLNGPAYAYAYAWVSTSNANSTPLADYSRNSSGGVNTVTRSSQGVYNVRLPGLAADSYVWEISRGNAQVTAHGGDNDASHCSVNNISRSGSDVVVAVRCFGPSGSAADARFLISYVRRSVVHIEEELGAYLTSDLASSSHTPAWRTQWNSNGNPNRVERVSAGRYLVTLPKLNDSGDEDVSVAATAYGSSTARRCKVGSFAQSIFDFAVDVRCFLNGTPTDSRFSLIVTRQDYSPIGNYTGGATHGFAYADNPTSALNQPYTPSNQDYSGTQLLSVVRVATGRYDVIAPPNQLPSSSALVTAVGTGSEHCKLMAFGLGAQVRCFSNSGAPVNTRFNVAFVGGAQL